MIGEGRFRTQLSTVEAILKKLNLLEERQMSPNKGLGAAHFRGLAYHAVYEECLRECAYDFRLSDQSLLLFVKGGQDQHTGFLNFCYYECPVAVMPYNDFVGMECELSPDAPDYAEQVAMWGDCLRADYEQYVTSVQAKTAVTPLRYDYRASDYREGLHPASHVHFGFSNEIRVGTRRVMNPISFTLLVTRQCYPKEWMQLLQLRSSHLWCRNVREDIDTVHNVYWKELDQFELALL